MVNTYRKADKRAFASLSSRAAMLGVLVLLCYPIPSLTKRLNLFPPSALDKLAGIALITGAALLLLALVVEVLTPATARITCMVCRGLYDPARGNPLHLRTGERLPRVRCKRTEEGRYDLTISAQESATVDTIRAAAPSISSALNRRFQRYAVVGVDQDVAGNAVTFRLEDVTVEHTIIFSSIKEMRPKSPTLLRVDKANNIDLTTSGSMLVVGKTRSGKTTGVISQLIQVLLAGPDEYDSQVVIIDPKQAELSRLPHVVTLDRDGEARAILEAMRDFADTITRRQSVLNDYSAEVGAAVQWSQIEMHPSFIFIDEYVALRSIFPKRAEKDSDYCLDTFDDLLKRIVTMGASAGCFAIISIAEASVQEGGLPAMLRSAMSTRILFRPTKAEALLIWDKERIDTLPQRTYGPGDAWFSSTDGVHEAVSFVHFPRMEFGEYNALSYLLREYYADRQASGGASGSEADAGPSGAEGASITPSATSVTCSENPGVGVSDYAEGQPEPEMAVDPEQSPEQRPDP